jgi:hypothetical protein
VLMTGLDLSPEETAECERFGVPLLRKPFLGDEAVNLIRSSLAHAPIAKSVGR